jgi:hypothetical protein
MGVLYLRQVNKYIIVEGNVGEYAVGNTTPHTFIVKSNIPWHSMFDGTKGDEFTLVNTKTASGGPNPEGEIFEFKLNNVPGAEATFSFKSSENGVTYAEATIEGAAPFVTLDQTTYSTNVAVPPPANISMTTNIPLDELSATVTGPGVLVTDAAIVPGPVLRVNFATNTLTDASLQTYTVQVKHDAQVMATLTVHVSGSGWEVIGGKLVGPLTGSISLQIVLEDATYCPSGSSQPRSSTEAMWYEANLGSMQLPSSVLFTADGRHGGSNFSGVLWLGSTREEALGINGYHTSFWVAPCVWNQEIVSGGYLTLLESPNGIALTPPSVNYPYGQYVGTTNNYVSVKFRCVVW